MAIIDFLLFVSLGVSLLARNGCVCEGNSAGVNLPFSQLLFPRVSARSLHTAFRASELDEMKERRAKEYQSFQMRSVMRGVARSAQS